MADACLESGRLVLALNYSSTPSEKSFSGNETIDSDTCDYLATTSKDSNPEGIIISHSAINNAHTYYKVVVDANTPETDIISFEQLTHYP